MDEETHTRAASIWRKSGKSNEIFLRNIFFLTKMAQFSFYGIDSERSRERKRARDRGRGRERERERERES